MWKHVGVTFIALFLMIGMVSCQNVSDPGDTIETYLQALIDDDAALAANLSCADWESQATTEGAAFEGVEAALDKADCTASAQDDAGLTVSCTGQIIFSYAGGEDQQIDLSERNYLVVEEGGEWKMCGYR